MTDLRHAGACRVMKTVNQPPVLLKTKTPQRGSLASRVYLSKTTINNNNDIIVISNLC